MTLIPTIESANHAAVSLKYIWLLYLNYMYHKLIIAGLSCSCFILLMSLGMIIPIGKCLTLQFYFQWSGHLSTMLPLKLRHGYTCT